MCWVSCSRHNGEMRFVLLCDTGHFPGCYTVQLPETHRLHQSSPVVTHCRRYIRQKKTVFGEARGEKKKRDGGEGNLGRSASILRKCNREGKAMRHFIKSGHLRRQRNNGIQTAGPTRDIESVSSRSAAVPRLSSSRLHKSPAELAEEGGRSEGVFSCLSLTAVSNLKPPARHDLCVALSRFGESERRREKEREREGKQNKTKKKPVTRGG